MAAGNGGAMRIAPLAFVVDPQEDRQVIRDVVRITHHSDEAYLGALAVLLALRHPEWLSEPDLLERVAEPLPDCRVRDQLRRVATSPQGNDLAAMATAYGCGGYVVETLPMALLGAQRLLSDGFRAVIDAIDAAGGDTDTIVSIAGQLMGSATGSAGLPPDLLELLPEKKFITDVATAFAGAVRAAEREDGA